MTSKPTEEQLKKSLELLGHYRLLFKNHPRKKYFVPLAEIYRSLECFDEAIQVLKEGLKYHPEYIIARALLAQTYFQMGYFAQANHEARKAIESDLENILALKIYIQSCSKLGLTPQSTFLQTPIGAIEDFELKPLTPKNDKKEVIDALNRLLIKIDQNRGQKKGELCQPF
ncbi:MAG: tetratricopeptide repeat protein [Deltaproteobacteria bacterium]